MKYDTKSEQLFSDICKRHGYSITKVPTRSDEQKQSPDFRVRTPFGDFIAEIKEITPNEDDMRQIREMRDTGSTSGGGEIGSRARRAIRKAAKQLRTYKNHEIPLIVVLYDNARDGDYRVSYPMYYTEGFHIDTAMYGSRVVYVPLKKGVIRQPDKNGGGRTTTASEKTYLSAIVVISDWDDEHIMVYHNSFATTPLSTSILADDKSVHYSKGKYVYGEPWKWNEIKKSS